MSIKSHLILPVVLVIFINLALFFYYFTDAPQVKGEAYGEIDITQDPVQTDISSAKPIMKTIDGDNYTITPLANYKASVLVACKKHYHSDDTAKISPVDLCVIWGELTEPEYRKYIGFSQMGRFCYFRYSYDIDLSESYVKTHMSNNHIIPANENVLNAVKSVSVEDKVILEGMLVEVKINNYPQKWTSSLERTDERRGACEVFYVERIRIGNNIYE